MPEPKRTVNDMAGNVAGSAVQAGAIHGDVYFHEVRSGLPEIPRQLPAATSSFTGRTGEIAFLDDVQQRDRPAIAVLTGPGGIGKTALATQWAHDAHDRFPDGALYIDLGGTSEDEAVDPGRALTMFIGALGVAHRRIPAALAEQVALYRSVTAGRAILVLLDNAFSAAQARVLFPASRTGMTLVTSRSRLHGLVPDGARLLDIAPLPPDESVALLARSIGAQRVDREAERAAELVAFCGGMPIALSLAAARLAARPHLSVGRLAAELAGEADRLDRLTSAEGRSVRAVFDSSYHSLGEDAAALYRGLSLHPGRDFGLGPVAAVLTPYEDALDQLLRANLVQEVDENRFRFHDLIRLHARQLATGDGPVLLAMLEWYLAATRRAERVLTPYLRRPQYRYVTAPRDLPDLGDRTTALDWLERERANLVEAVRCALDAGHSGLSWHLAYVMWPLFLFHKHLDDWHETAELGLEAARRLRDPRTEAEMLKRLSGSRVAIGDLAEAERLTRQAIARFHDAGDTRGGVDSRESLAKIYRRRGRTGEAVQLLGEVLAANRRTGPDRSIGLSLYNLADALVGVGRPVDAAPLFREAADRLRSDPYNSFRAVSGLARAQFAAGDTDAAERHATEAAIRLHDLGSDFETAIATRLLGDIALRRADVPAARRHYADALATFETLGVPETASVRQQLADLEPEAVD
jgi:tetratricopeptide (TPR) repeat protein